MMSLHSIHAAGLIPLGAQKVHRSNKPSVPRRAVTIAASANKSDLHPYHGDDANDVASAAAATAALLTLTTSLAAEAATSSPAAARASEVAKHSGVFHIPGSFPPVLPNMEEIEFPPMLPKMEEMDFSMQAHVDGINDTVAVSQAAVETAARGLEAAAVSAAGQYPALSGVTDAAIEFNNEIIYGTVAIAILFLWDGVDRIISRPSTSSNYNGSMTYSFKKQDKAWRATAKSLQDKEMQTAMTYRFKKPQESSGELVSNAVSMNREKKEEEETAVSRPPSFWDFAGLRDKERK